MPPATPGDQVRRARARLDDALQRDREPDAAAADAVGERVQGTLQDAADVGHRADDRSGADAMAHQRRGVGQHEHQRQPAANRQAQRPEQVHPGERPQGGCLLGHPAGDLGAHLVLRSARDGIAKAIEGCRGRVSHPLLADDRPALPGGEGRQQAAEQPQ